VTRINIVLLSCVLLGPVMVLNFLEWVGWSSTNWTRSALAQSVPASHSAVSSVLTPDPEDVPFFRAIVDDQEKKLSSCKNEDECRAVHFLLGVAALYENRELAALHFRKVVGSNPNSALAGESRFWLWLLDVLNAPGEGAITSEAFTKRLVREIVNRELLVHELSRQLETDSVDALKQELTIREKAVEDLNQASSNLSKQSEQLKKEQTLRQDVLQELRASERKVQELTNQLEALRRIDQEIREKAPPTRPSEKMAPTPKLERAEEKEIPNEGEGKK
jgi:TolA-binding protein